MHDYHANKTICNEAHITLQLFLNTMSSNLKPLQFKVCKNLLFIIQIVLKNIYIYFLDFSKYSNRFAIRSD